MNFSNPNSPAFDSQHLYLPKTPAKNSRNPLDRLDDQRRRGLVLQHKQPHSIAHITIELLGDLIGVL
jgi:hypothetical protein